MIKVIGSAVLLILLLRIVAGSSGAVELCSKVLDETRTKTGNLTCDAIKDFSNCVLNGSSNANVTLSVKERIAEIEALKEKTDQLSLEMGNADCEIDYKPKLKELEEKLKKELTSKVENLMSEANVMMCIGKMTLSFLSGCDAAKDAAKCAMRASGFTHPDNMTEENIAAMKKQLDEKFTSVGLNCDLDYPALAKEVHSEEEEMSTAGVATHARLTPFHLIGIVALTIASTIVRP